MRPKQIQYFKLLHSHCLGIVLTMSINLCACMHSFFFMLCIQFADILLNLCPDVTCHLCQGRLSTKYNYKYKYKYISFDPCPDVSCQPCQVRLSTKSKSGLRRNPNSTTGYCGKDVGSTFCPQFSLKSLCLW